MYDVFNTKGRVYGWPSFKTVEAAKNEIKANTGLFYNGEILLIVDFINQETHFVQLNLTMKVYDL